MWHDTGGLLPAHELEVARDVCFSLCLCEHRLADRVERGERAARRERCERIPDRACALLDQKQPRRAGDVRAHRPCERRLIAELEEPPPHSREFVSSEIGFEVVGDLCGAVELRQRVDELKQRGAQPLVGERPLQQRAAHAAGAEERRGRLHRVAVELAADFADQRFEPGFL